MIWRLRFLLLEGFMVILALLAGCGQNDTTTGTNQPSSHPTATSGPVTLHTDASSYQVRSTILVTLNNQSSKTISFPDHLTNCTVVLLQRQKVRPVQPPESRNGQAGINPCRLAIATRMHALGAWQSLMVKLVAPSNGWLPGLYLATLSYRTPLTANPLTTIYSAVFQVGPAGPPEP